MADVDIDPFGGTERGGEHESRLDQPAGEHIPLPLVTPGERSI